MFKKVLSFFSGVKAKVASLFTVALVTALTSAQAAIDVSAATDAIDEVGPALVSVGSAVIAIAGIWMAYKWIKSYVKGA